MDPPHYCLVRPWRIVMTAEDRARGTLFRQSLSDFSGAVRQTYPSSMFGVYPSRMCQQAMPTAEVDSSQRHRFFETAPRFLQKNEQVGERRIGPLEHLDPLANRDVRITSRPQRMGRGYW